MVCPLPGHNSKQTLFGTFSEFDFKALKNAHFFVMEIRVLNLHKKLTKTTKRVLTFRGHCDKLFVFSDRNSFSDGCPNLGPRR